MRGDPRGIPQRSPARRQGSGGWLHLAAVSPDRSERDRSAVWWRRALVAGLVPVAVWSCAREGVGGARFPDAPVVLISIDTLRSDRLPVYGYERGSTPAIDALRRDGILAARAYTHVPLTLPAHASLFTGLLPPDHGVRDNSGYRLRDERRGLARAPGESGGVRHRRAPSPPTCCAPRPGSRLGVRSLRGRNRPRLGRKSRRAAAGRQRVAARLAALAARSGRRRALLPLLAPSLRAPHAVLDRPSPTARAFASPYDGEIAAADAAVGELVKELRELDVYDAQSGGRCSPTTAKASAITARTSTASLLYREALQVPLLRQAARRRHAPATVLARPAQLVDVLPDDPRRDRARSATGARRPLAARAIAGRPTRARTRARRGAGRSTPRPTTRASITAGASCAR